MKEIIITATVLILCVLLIRRIFRGKISSRLQYTLWFLVALRLMIPVSAQIDLGPLTRFRLMDLVDQMELAQGDVAKRLAEPIHVTVDVNSQSMLYRLIGNDEQKAKIEDAISNMPDDGASSVFMAGTLGFSWLDVLTILWTAGMLVVGLWIIVSNVVFGHKLKKSRRPFVLSEAEMDALLKKGDGSDIFRNKGKSRLPAFYLIDHISSPCLYGFFGREAVYLTEEVTKDPERLRHVLVHELIHKKHGDSFWALLRSVLVTVYWFHPLVWVAAACSKRDCELACDEGALALLGDEERIPYGETLLSIIIRKGRLSDLVCTATTMTGSGKSMKERVQFIAKKPRVIYAAVAAVFLVMIGVCVFVFTQNPQFKGGILVNSPDGITVTGADMQIQLPASISGISGYVVEKESDDVVIYHMKAQKEVGRFSRVTFGKAIEMVDAGQEIVPIGDQGYNYLLRAYMGEPLTWTEHSYTLPEDQLEHVEPAGAGTERTEHTYTPAEEKNQGVLRHEDIYLPEESITTQPVDPNDDENTFRIEHTYIPAEETGTGVPGTDSNDDTTYVINGTAVPGKDSDYNPMLDTDWEVIPLEEEMAEEVKVDYLPNEMIRTTEYQPREITADEIDEGCYLYVKADYDKINGKYAQEMTFIDEELRKAASDVIILSLNRRRREALFDGLTKNRTLYVGDNVKVGALLEALPLPPTFSRAEGFSLQTVEKPYSLRFGYEMSTDIFTKDDQDMIYFNAAMLFYSIGNVEEISVEIKNPSGKNFMMRVYYREEMEKDIPALQNVDYGNEQIFRETLSEVHVEVEKRISTVTE